jgi:hypothetical protein
VTVSFKRRPLTPWELVMQNARYTGHHRGVLEWAHNIMKSRSSGLLLFIAMKASSDQKTSTMRDLKPPPRYVRPCGLLHSAD